MEREINTPARKNKTVSAEELFNSISDIVIKVKEQLAGTTSRHSLKLLQELATLAESFTQHRSKSKTKNLNSFADSLDREGVNLWNTSTFLKQEKDDVEKHKFFASLRLAAFRLIEAGLEPKPSIATLIHVLQLASKTGSALSVCGFHEAASSVLACAAKFEEALHNAEDPDNVNAKSKAAAVVAYYTGRMDAAWNENNENVAFFMLQQASDEQKLSLLPPFNHEHLAAKALEIGKCMLRSAKDGVKGGGDSSADVKHANSAIRWIQKAFQLLEKMSEADGPGLAVLKRASLRSLARAYYISSSVEANNLGRADAAVDELIAAIDDADDTKNSDNQELRWMKIAILKKRKAGEKELFDAFKQLIANVKFDETNVNDILQDLRGVAENQHALITAVSHHFLETALDSPSKWGHTFVDRILLSLIFHCKSDENSDQSLKEIETACATISKHPEYVLPKVPTVACQSLLWQFGDRLYNSKKWSQAAEWYFLSAHPAFKIMASTSNAKCLRKTALCYIQQGDYAKATSVIKRCTGNEAASYYVLFLTAAHQGLEAEAIKAIHDMMKASDFDRKMLLLATQLAHDNQLKTLLLAVLEALIRTLQSDVGLASEMEGITLTRCMIRLVLELIKQPAADVRDHVETLIRHLRNAINLVDSALANKDAALITKDISWLWRTTYNVAVQGCSDWDHEQVSELFDIARLFMEAYCKVSVDDADPNIHTYMRLASFSAICGRVFAARRLAAGEAQIALRRRILEDLKSFKTLCRGKLTTQDDAERERIESLTHFAAVFETEQLCHLRDWDVLLTAAEDLSQSVTNVTLDTLEAIADILWIEPDCPTNVLYSVLEVILRTSLDNGILNIEKFSRWLRAICSILLSRNRPSDRLKALGYVEQAVEVLKDHPNIGDTDETYPMEERHWLLTTSYNTGVECFGSSNLDEAKRWFETATMIAKQVENSEAKSQKISETYQSLLSRYSRAPASH